MKVMNATFLRDAFVSGANNLINHQNRIDDMNVFPIPDGDTGSNMASTAKSAILAINEKTFKTVYEVTRLFARGMLVGARGNSGVILSQIFKGFSVGLEGKQELKSFDFVLAFEKAREFAYKAVIKPVEGTMLTVISEVAKKLSKTITASDNFQVVFEMAYYTAKEACANTPNLLGVLKEVGVTDSGGEGLLMLIQGMLNFIIGKPVKLIDSKPAQKSSSLTSGHLDQDNNFGYCTELIIELENEANFRKDRFQTTLAKLGDSIVLVKDDNLVKLHMHTLKSGSVLTYAQRFGEFHKIKIENMTLQANESNSAKNRLQSKIINGNSNKNKKISIISCNSGSGIIDEMEKLGATCIIEAGQSQNPLARDFIDAIKQVTTNKVIILPNNPNIILTAQQVVQTTKKEVVVIPTKTQMEGIVAMLNFNPNGDFQDVRESMEDALDDVKTGAVSIANRTTKINGVQVRDGEYLAIVEARIIKSCRSKIAAAIEICKNLINDNIEIVTIYYGEDASKIDAEEIRTFIEDECDADVEIKFGGQTVYNFLIAFE